MTVTLDFETKSFADLKKVGAEQYARDPTTDVICACWGIDDGEIQSWWPGLHDTDDMPSSLYEAIFDEGHNIEAHHVSFEFFIWTHVMHAKYGWPIPKWDRWRDTMAVACYYAMPAALDRLCRAAGFGGKDPEGARLITKYSKLYLKTAKTIIPPGDFAKFVKYCKHDIRMEQSISDWLGDLPARELAVYLLWLQISIRGLHLDADGIAAATDIVAQRSDILTIEHIQLTGLKPTQGVKLLAWFEQQGLPLENMQAAYLEEVIEDGEILSGPTRRALEIRLLINKASTKKLDAMSRHRGAGGRARFQTRYHGAVTGRETGSGFQPLNLNRGFEGMDPAQLSRDIGYRNAAYLDALYGDATDAVAKASRYWIQAQPGNKIIAGDFASVEAVVLACLGAQTKVLTNCGWKSIIHVQLMDLLWDGEEWVSHGGLVYQGTQKTIDMAGVQITPDHLIQVGSRWFPASAVASSVSTLSQALATGLRSLPLWATSGGHWGASTVCGFSVPAVGLHIWRKLRTGVTKHAHAANIARQFIRPLGLYDTLSTLALSPMLGMDGDCCVELRGQSSAVIISRTKDTKATAREGSKFTPRGEKIAQNSLNICPGSPVGIIQRFKLTALTMIRGTNQVIYALLRALKICSIGARWKNYNSVFKSWKPVYDIVNAGPRQRFTILTHSGPAVVHNCVAGEQWKIDAFAKGVKIYECMADKIYGLAPGTVTKESHPQERQDGKTGELAFGYQGALGAWLKFDNSGRHSDERIVEICKAWRAEHPETVALWAGLGYASLRTVHTKQPSVYRPGLDGNVVRDGDGAQTPPQVRFEIVDEWLTMELPDGKLLWYFKPEIRMHMPQWHKPFSDPDCALLRCDCRVRPTLTYMAQKEGQWRRVHTYGGKLTENYVQATARQLLEYAKQTVANAYDHVLRKTGFLRDDESSIILTLYDEIVVEVPKDFSSGAEFIRHMLRKTSWAKNWPINASVWEGERFKK